MKTRRSFQEAVSCPPQKRLGMTLVEVVVALAVTGLTVGGVVAGYIYCTTAAVKAELVQAASARAMERIEQARSAQWNTAGSTNVDQLVPTNFPVEVVSLDMPGSGSGGTSATILTTITPISVSPPLKDVRVDCVWRFRGAELITNTIETIRAPDQ